MKTRLLVLGVLAERPMHGYEIQQWMARSRTDVWADVKPGSLYHALRQLESEQLIRVVDVFAQGMRARTVYGITPAGRRELEALVENGWQQLPRTYPTDLYTLITFSRLLPRRELRRRATELRRRLLRTLESWTTGGDEKLAATGHDPLIDAMIRNGIAHLQADAELLRRLADDKT